MGVSRPIQFDIWGARGSRSLVPGRSVIATYTACFSLLDEENLLILDAGRGLLGLSNALDVQPAFRAVRHVHLFISHPHMDHWEGLKDSEWFWKRNPLAFRLHANTEAMEVIRTAHAHPSFVPLEVLGEHSLADIVQERLVAGKEVRVGRWTVLPVSLHHYSGDRLRPTPVPTLGFRVSMENGPTVAYISDHDPQPHTRPAEEQLLENAHLAVYDAHFCDRAQQNHGHGSQEHAASMARERPEIVVLAGHLGPGLSDAELNQARNRHGGGVPNFELASERMSYVWATDKQAFVKGTRFDPTAEARSKARHDLRTPINQIIGYSEMLAEITEEEGRKDLTQDLEKIRAAARRQLELIDIHLADPGARTREEPAGGAPAPAAAKPVSTDAQETAAAPPTKPAPVAEHTESESEAENIPMGEGRLLVVDDNPMNRDMLARRLESRGFKVAVAEDGQSALDRVAADRFDLILLDVMMPGISGLEVLHLLRQNHSSSDLPVIMATARDHSDDIVGALRLGANDYVTKPLDFPVVMARVQAQLALKRQKEEIQYLAERLEVRNQFIQNTFGRYLSDQVVASLLESPSGLKLGGESRKVSILMSDLRGFTAVSERLGPEQVVRMLNLYLGAMADVIFQFQGTIDEFIGDAILALFGAPISREDDAPRAVACAVSMQMAMESVNRQLLEEGLPAIEMGIALHTGEVVVGNIGSKRRTKYGIVGPPVNMTGRIESYTVGGQVLISEATIKEIGPILKLGQPIVVKAKGSNEPLLVYDLIGIAGEHNLFLRQRDEFLHQLPRPLPIRFTILEGKQVGDERYDGALARLSTSGAEMRSDHPVSVLANLLIRVRDESGAELPGDLYAKVLEVGNTESDRITVRFTAIPPSIDAFFRKTIGLA